MENLINFAVATEQTAQIKWCDNSAIDWLIESTICTAPGRFVFDGILTTRLIQMCVAWFDSQRCTFSMSNEHQTYTAQWDGFTISMRSGCRSFNAGHILFTVEKGYHPDEQTLRVNWWVD